MLFLNAAAEFFGGIGGVAGFLFVVGSATVEDADAAGAKTSTGGPNNSLVRTQLPLQRGSGGNRLGLEMVARISGTWRDQMIRG